MTAIATTTALRLQTTMAAAGWHIEYIDIDLTAEQPKVEIEVRRVDGRIVFAKVDRLGRASIETFQRSRSLGMSTQTKGRRPLSPQIDDLFMGRSSFPGARSMLRNLTGYLTDNAAAPVDLSDMRAAWALAMSAPQRIEA